MVWGGAHFIIREYNLIALCSSFDKSPKEVRCALLFFKNSLENIAQ